MKNLTTEKLNIASRTWLDEPLENILDATWDEKSKFAAVDKIRWLRAWDNATDNERAKLTFLLAKSATWDNSCYLNNKFCPPWLAAGIKTADGTLAELIALLYLRHRHEPVVLENTHRFIINGPDATENKIINFRGEPDILANGKNLEIKACTRIKSPRDLPDKITLALLKEPNSQRLIFITTENNTDLFKGSLTLFDYDVENKIFRNIEKVDNLRSEVWYLLLKDANGWEKFIKDGQIKHEMDYSDKGENFNI